MGVHKQGETLTETLKRLRLEGSTPTEMARPPKRPRDFSGPGTYKEALTNIKIAILKETYPEDKLIEDDLSSILEELGRVLRGTPIGELPHLKSYRLEGAAIIYIRGVFKKHRTFGRQKYIY
jgi:predicted RNase H-like HicB family nuclease